MAIISQARHFGQKLVSNCQTDMTPFCRLFFPSFRITIIRIFSVRISFKISIMFSICFFG